MTDPYQVLGIGPEASEEEIRRRYLELVRRHPPDRDPAKFAAVRQAYEKLRDPVERLKSKLFDVESSETMDDVMADVKKRLRASRIPTETLLTLAELR
jgi:curved DNA-binding protein CbpA